MLPQNQRLEYIQSQKNQEQRRVVTVLPIHYPKALLWAANILPVELWGPPGEPRGPANGRIQSYVCPVARNALAFLAHGGADITDAVLFPHTCDSLQQLATLAPDFGGLDKKVFRFYHPKGERRTSSINFLLTEHQRLADEISAWTQKELQSTKLSEALNLWKNIMQLQQKLLEHRVQCPWDDTQLYTWLRRGEFLWPTDYLLELQEAERALEPSPRNSQIGVLVTGYVPEPKNWLAVLNQAGAQIVADDYAAVGRRVLRQPWPTTSSPFEVLGELWFALPPCPTKHTDLKYRLSYLENLFQQSHAQGVIIHTIKFCEPELFDVPAIRQHFSTKGIPVLHLETELEKNISGQMTTRIEAFVEMLRHP